MKKRIFIFSLFLIIPVPSISSAMSISAGSYNWFTWWDAALSQAFKKSTFIQYKVDRESYIDPTFLYGGALSFKFNDLVSWSTVFITGEYDLTNRGYETGPTYAWVPTYTDYSQTVRRYDVDTALNFRITDTVSIFGGIKYQHYLIDNFWNWGSAFAYGKITFNEIAFAVGPGFKFHLGADFFLFLNISVAYQLILFDLNGTVFEPAVGFFGIGAETEFHAIGANSTLSLAYLIRQISVTLTVGFRYQVFYIFDTEHNDVRQEEFLSLSNEFDHFYGIIFSALYTFDF
jgi:hypothetical protein